MSATPPCTPLFSRRLYSALVTSLPSGTSLCHCAGAVVLLLGALGHAHAGRPLGVDDAGVNDAGHGHLEMWWEGPRGERGTVLAAPAYAPIEGVELGALLARDLQGHATLQGMQAKWLWTAPAEQGCNAASSAGVQHTRQQSGNTVSVALLGTCTGDWGAVHANLGAQREPQAQWLPTWGLAYERAYPRASGDITAHIEAFGRRHGAPTFQTGLRWAFSADWQLDGTVGRKQGTTLLSVGLKRSFH